MCKKYYVGLDLHANNTVIGISDENDHRILKGRFPNNLEAISEALMFYKDCIVGVVVESTFNWYWLVDGLMEQGYTLHLANPGAIKQYNGLKFTDDEHDAFFLAKLLRLGILPQGYIYPKNDRHLRDLLRKRLKLVRERTMHYLSLKSLINRNTGLNIPSARLKVIDESDLRSMLANTHLFLSAKITLDAIHYLSQEIKSLEKILLMEARLKPEFEKLLSVEGIGKILAMTIALETGDVNRFPTVGDFSSYCRCVGSLRLSDNKKKGENNRKNGNQYLAWAFVEASHFHRRFCPQAGAFFQRKVTQRNKNVAVKALAHKLARACYYIMRDRVSYDKTKVFGVPIQSDKGSGSKPIRGLASNQ